MSISCSLLSFCASFFLGIGAIFGARLITHHDLDYVARHLSIHECRRLSEALHMKHLELDHPVDGELEPHLHCLELLRHWSTHEGRRQSFSTLSLRLDEIGRSDVGEGLEKLMFKEIEEGLEHTAFNDTYLSRTVVYKDDEKLTDEEAVKEAERESGEEPEGTPGPEKQKMTPFHITTIVMFIASIIGLILFIVFGRKNGVKCPKVKGYLKNIQHRSYMRTEGKIPYDVMVEEEAERKEMEELED